jgi:2-oxoglutarate ferredoxin oxidoreductase subunit alpha
MRLNIVFGGRAGQGINLISKIVSQVIIKHGYYTFNYRDYPSIIRGGHNFNVLSISDEKIESHESTLDGIVAMDDNTISVHKPNLNKSGFIIAPDKFLEFGMNLNIALAGALMKILGFDPKTLQEEIKSSIRKNTEDALKAAETGYASQEKKYSLHNTKKKLQILSGSQAIGIGAINSKIDMYIAYPMTPATPVLHFLSGQQEKNNFTVFQPEGEIAAVNMALGSSFAGARTMTGTSGGGFDLMTEALSLQGQSEIPLVVYLVARPGPATGIPTYTSQGDLNIALRSGHGEFPRVVIAPGTPKQTIEATNQAFHLSETHGVLSIVLTDKHLSESEFTMEGTPAPPIPVKIARKTPGEAVVKATSYEHDEFGNTTEDAKQAEKNGLARIQKYKEIKKAAKKFPMIEIHGNPKSKNLIVSWGSPTGAIKDAIKGLDVKFLQIIYAKPMSDEVKKHLEAAKNTMLIENNLTGQMGRLIREKTGISIKNRLLKFDGRPFHSDVLHKQIKKEFKLK